MDIQSIQKRREKLLGDLEQAKANVHALQGAIQDCDYWIEQMKQAVEELGTEK